MKKRKSRTRSGRWCWDERDHRTSGMDWIGRSLRAAIYLRDGKRCLRCGDTNDLSLDHVRDAGGRTDPKNLATLCVSCNRERGERKIEEFDPAYAAEAETQCEVPVDVRSGRDLARKLWPSWHERVTKARAKYERKKRAA